MTKVATVLSDNYMPLFTAFIRSLLKHNSWFDYEINIICDDTLNIYNRELVKSLYGNIKFINIDYSKYENKSNIRFKSIELFNIEADKVIFFDSDLLILGDIKKLFEVESDIAMVKENRRPCFNAGVIIIGKKYLNKKTYNDLLNFDISSIPGYGTDQKIYNNYFKNITILENKYNALISEIKNVNDTLILHYIYKPHISIGKRRLSQDMIDLWRKYYEC